MDQLSASPLIQPSMLLVRKLASIASLSVEDRAAIASMPITTRAVSERTSLVHEGDASTHCRLIVDGWAYRYRTLANGQRQIFSLYVPGDIPDIESLHLHMMDHGLMAMAKTKVAFIAHKDMHHLIERRPAIASALWRDSLVDAVRCRERVTSLGRRQALGGLAHLFCELYVRLDAVGLADDLRYGWPLTQTELADVLGLSAVHANRSLQELRKMGLVILQNRQMIIRDWSGLVTVAEFDPSYLHII